MWTRGGFGDFYLRQIRAGGGQDSPCIDAGEENILTILQLPPPDGYNLPYDVTTSIQNHFDIGYTDMGFHYPPSYGPPIKYRLTVNVVGPGYVEYYDAQGQLVTIDQNSSPAISYFFPGSVVSMDAYSTADHWGYWSGTDDDLSWNTWNTVSMYNDRNVTVSFEFIVGRRLYVPAEYPLLQDAIDDSRYKDVIELDPAGRDNPYRTSMGYLIANSRAITITSTNPDDPCVVAATVIELEAPDPGGHVSRAFTFCNPLCFRIADYQALRNHRLQYHRRRWRPWF